ncbi:MAG: hypothetical protein FE042_05800, partial [Thermoplasmata archaeon]
MTEGDMEEVTSKGLKLVMVKGIVALGFVLATNLNKFRELGIEAKHVKYERPPRRYEIPEYKEGMKVCESDE